MLSCVGFHIQNKNDGPVYLSSLKILELISCLALNPPILASYWLSMSQYESSHRDICDM